MSTTFRTSLSGFLTAYLINYKKKNVYFSFFCFFLIFSKKNIFFEVKVSKLVTKRAIVSVFRTMIRTTPFNKITIGDLTKNTGLNRQTFYYHFRDLYDMLLFMVEDDILPIVAGERDFSTCMMKIYDFCMEHKQMLLNIYNHIELDEINHRLKPIIENLAAHMVDDVTSQYPLSQEDMGIAVSFTALMITEFILRWIKRGMSDKKQEFSKFADLLECNMKSTIRFLYEEA